MACGLAKYISGSLYTKESLCAGDSGELKQNNFYKKMEGFSNFSPEREKADKKTEKNREREKTTEFFKLGVSNILVFFCLVILLFVWLQCKSYHC